MLSVIHSLLLMTALFNGALAVFILRNNWKKPTNLFLGIYLVSLAVWALALIGTQIGDAYQLWFYSTKVTYISGLIIAASFYLFSISFPDDVWPRRGVTWSVYGITALFSAALLAHPTYLVEQIVSYEWGNGAALEPLAYIIFTVLFVFLYIGGLFRIWLKYLRAGGTTKTKLLVIALGVSITGFAGLFFDIILASPFINDFRYIWSGPLFNTIMAVLIVYAVFRFKLLNTKVIFTELLIGLLWIFTLLRTLLASDSREQLWNGGLFILAFIIGGLLVRSVRAEVRQRELIEEQNKQLEFANIEKSEFMSFASHEVRNPLTAMRGYASMIAEGNYGDVSPEVKRAAQRIMITGQEVVSLIGQFLDKSKMELGELKYEFAPFDVNEAIREVAGGFRLAASDKGLQLKVQTGSQRLVVQGDPGRIKSVVGNLLDNAIKYTEEGSVTVATERRGEETVRITIEDTGDGISDHVKPHLFKKFTRADARKRNLAGTGIGLYLAKQFVEAHSGRIWLESEGEEMGTTFIIELPLSHEKPYTQAASA